MKNNFVKYLLAITSLTFINIEWGYSCSIAMDPVTHIFSHAEKSRAALQAGSQVTISMKTTAYMATCPNGFGISFAQQSEATAHGKKYNEAVKACVKLFQLYMLSDKLNFSIYASQAQDIVNYIPSCQIYFD
jgi:hypothetical protein